MEKDNLNFDLDALLEEAKGYSSGESAPAASAAAAGSWSLDDIDALIAGLDEPAKPAPIKEEKEEKAEEEPEYEAKQIKEFPDEDVPVKEYFRKDAKPEPVAIEPAAEEEPEKEEENDGEPSFLYDSEMSEAEIDSLVSSLFGDFMPDTPKAEEAVKAVEDEDDEPATQIYENEKPVTAPVEKAEEEQEKSEPEKAAPVNEEPEKKGASQKTAEIPTAPLYEDVYSGAEPGPVDISDVPVKQEEPVEIPPEKPKGEIREFSRSKANANKLAGMVINDFVPKKKEEEKTDPDRIPDYDPLAVYMAAQKESEEAGMETDENRESFLNPMKLEDTAEIDNDFLEPIDKPGILFKKNQYEMTSDLDPLPIVISADKAKAVDRTRVATTKKEPAPEEIKDEEFPGQIKLSGFEPVPEESLPDNTSEAELEAMLSESRRHKAKDFIVSSEEIDGEPEEIDGISFEKIADETAPAEESPAPVKKKKPKKQGNGRRLYSLGKPLPEYNEPGDRRHVHSSLNAAGIICLRQLLIDALIGIVLFIFNMVAAFSETDIFCRGGAGYYIANAVLLIIAAVFNSRILMSGFNAILRGEPDASAAATAVNALIFLHITVSAAVEIRQGGDTPVFAMLGVLAFAAVSAADYFNARRIIKNFELCAYKYEKKLYTIHDFEDENEIRELSRGIMLDRADLLYSSQTDFPEGFMRYSGSGQTEIRAVKRVLPVAGVAAIVTAAVSAFISRDGLAAFTAAVGAFGLCAPLFASFIPAVSLNSAGKALNKDGAFVSGLDSAAEFTNTNGVVLDSGDIFNRTKCRMHGMVDFKQIRMDDLLVYAAALVIKSNGPLRECFENVISEDHNLLPTVRDLAYEDKLGVSARIHSQKVLLGNRTLLENHGVNVPDISLEEKYTSTGKRALYLAVCGKLAAMFVVSYAVDLNLRPYFKKLEDAGISIIVRTNDVNVTEDLLSRGFGLPKTAFCVLGSVAGRLFARRRNEVSPSAPAKLGHNGNAFTMLRAVTAAAALVRNADFGVVLQIALSVLGFAVCAILAATSNVPGGITSCLIAAALAAAAYFVSDLINRKD